MKKLFVVILCLCVVFVAGFAGYRGYNIWKQKRLLRQARAFVAKGDGARALLCVRAALQSNPNNLEACRLMAAFTELARSPQALLWRSKLVDLQPDSITNRIDLARTAIEVGQLELAQKSLDGVADADKKTAFFQKAAGAVDLAAKRLPEAEAHFAEAARLEPTNPIAQLNLAVLRLRETNSQKIASGLAALQALASNPIARPDALRHLTADAIQRTNLSGALAFSQQLLALTNSTFRDRMMQLAILHLLTNAQESGFLLSLQRESTNNPAKAYEVCRWMNTTTTNWAKTLSWINALPPATRTNLPVPLVETDCHFGLKDWNGLLTNLANQTWAELDCLRLASRAYAFRELGSFGSAKAEWVQAVGVARNRPQLVMQLLGTVSIWGWEQEQEDLLWTIVNADSQAKWAVRRLGGLLYNRGDTPALQSLLSTALQSDKDNLSLKNNLAMTAFLLKSWDKNPHDLAREVYAKNPTNAVFVSTYAYSLLLQDQPAEALKSIERLPPNQLQSPSIAAYYGLILKAAGYPAKARQYLDLAGNAPLLPEEKKLVEQARRGT